MSSSTSAGSITLFDVLTVVFVVLKLTDVIDWSWWWVFSPLWIPLAILVGIIVGIIVLRVGS